MSTFDPIRYRDRILELILDNCRSEPILRDNLIFQGGGALHFVYGSPRFSNDLDFVCPDLSRLINLFHSSLEKGVYFNSKVIIPKIKEKPRILRASYQENDNMPSGKLEIYEIPSFETARVNGKYSNLLVESPQEIYADKIVASLERISRRGSLKPTDLFDLNFIRSVFNLTSRKSDIEKKASSYNNEQIFNFNALQRIIDYIEDPKNHQQFQESFRLSLNKDIFNRINFNSQYFSSFSEHFKQYL